jgi:hypothetical protein
MNFTGRLNKKNDLMGLKIDEVITNVSPLTETSTKNISSFITPKCQTNFSGD